MCQFMGYFIFFYSPLKVKEDITGNYPAVMEESSRLLMCFEVISPLEWLEQLVSNPQKDKDVISFCYTVLAGGLITVNHLEPLENKKHD